MRRFAIVGATMIAVLSAAGTAGADDEAEARDQLKQGYTLKQAGNCQDAVPHLARSVELKPTAKALLNLSDCEQRTGDLVAAQAHASRGREMAHQQQDAELVGIADGQLTAIDSRLPRLTIKLAPDAPPNSIVSRDGTPVEGASLGAALPVNPGRHTVSVTATGGRSRRFEVSVAEGERQEVTVDPGPSIREARREPEVEPGPKVRPASVAATEKPPLASEATYPREPEETSSPSRVPAYVVLGLGVASLAVGIATGVAADSKHDALASECNSQGICPLSAQGDLDAFHSMRTVSTVAYVVGAVGLAAGGVLWITAPSPHPTHASAHVWLGPGLAGVGGRF